MYMQIPYMVLGSSHMNHHMHSKKCEATTTTQQKGKATQHNFPETVVFQRKIGCLGWDLNLHVRPSQCFCYRDSSAGWVESSIEMSVASQPGKQVHGLVPSAHGVVTVLGRYNLTLCIHKQFFLRQLLLVRVIVSRPSLFVCYNCAASGGPIVRVEQKTAFNHYYMRILFIAFSIKYSVFQSHADVYCIYQEHSHSYSMMRCIGSSIMMTVTDVTCICMRRIVTDPVKKTILYNTSPISLTPQC